MRENETLIEAIWGEVDTELGEVVTDVVGLIVGGVLGGIAFQIVLADWSWGREVMWYVALFLIGVFAMGMVYLADDIGRGVARYRDGKAD